MSIINQAKPLNIDDLLKLTVGTMFKKFDDDGNGFLDKEETRKLLLMTITVLSGGDENSDEYMTRWNHEIKASEFDKVFELVDSDGSGTVTEDELVQFIKLITNL